jgi:hypothetical protein
MLKRILFIYIAVVVTSQPIYAQSFNRLLSYYRNHQVAEFKTEAEKIDQEAIRQNPDLEFFYIVVQANAETALSAYERLFKEGSDRVRYLAAEKLKEYHYARGYYITASDYDKYLIENAGTQLEHSDEKEIVRETIAAPSSDDNPYFIQVGAFSHRDNANQLSDMLTTQNVPTKIVLRTVGRNQLFCVWIEGKSTLDQTMEYANQIKERYDLNFRIIKE